MAQFDNQDFPDLQQTYNDQQVQKTQTKKKHVQNLVQSTKNLSKNIYAYAPKHQKVEKTLEKIQNVSGPLVKKLSLNLDNHLNNALDKVTPHFNTAVDKVTPHINTALTKVAPLKKKLENSGKLAQASEKVHNLTEKLLFSSENYLNLLHLSLQSNNQDENKSETQLVQSQGSKKARIQQLFVKIQTIAVLMGKKLDFKQFKGGLQQRLQLSENYENLVVLSELSMQLLKENIYQPSVNTFQVNFSKSKDTVQVTLNNIKGQNVKDLLPTIKGKMGYIKEAAVDFYQNKVVVNINKETFAQYQDKIKNDMTNLYQQTKKYDFKKNYEFKAISVQQKSKDIYQGALARIIMGGQTVKSLDVKKSGQSIYEGALQKIQSKKDQLNIGYQNILQVVNERKALKKQQEKGSEFEKEKQNSSNENSETTTTPELF